MPDDIKEILDFLKLNQYISETNLTYGYKLLNNTQVKSLTDYISNIKQERDSFEKIAEQNYKVAEAYKKKLLMIISLCREYQYHDEQCGNDENVNYQEIINTIGKIDKDRMFSGKSEGIYI